MAFNNEQIDNKQYGMKLGNYERWLKRASNRVFRRKMKQSIKADKPHPNHKQKSGWST